VREILADPATFPEDFGHVGVHICHEGRISKVVVHEAHHGESRLPDIGLARCDVEGQTPDLGRDSDVAAAVQEIIATFETRAFGQTRHRGRHHVFGQDVRRGGNDRGALD
jgi:hypothetical protein